MTKLGLSRAALISTCFLASSAYAAPPTASTAAFEDVPEPAPPQVVQPAPPAAPCPPPTAPSAVTPAAAVPAASLPVVSDPDAVFRAFSAFADQQRQQRIVGALGGVALGGATIAFGAVIDANPESTSMNPEFWYVVGGATAAGSLIGLLFRSKAEGIVDAVRAGDPGHTPEQAATMERKWGEMAADGKQSRVIGAVVGGVLGTGAIIGGAVLLSNANPATDEALWGGILIGAGAGLVLTVPLVLVLPTPVETAYAQYAATKPVTPTLQLSVRGAGLSLGGSF